MALYKNTEVKTDRKIVVATEVDMKTLGEVVLYTPPSGYEFVWSMYKIEVTAYDTPALSGALNIGTNSPAFDDMGAPNFLLSIGAVGEWHYGMSNESEFGGGTRKTPLAFGESIVADVVSVDTGVALKFKVHLSGYLFKV